MYVVLLCVKYSPTNCNTNYTFVMGRRCPPTLWEGGGGGVMVTDGALYGVHVYQIGHI